MSGVLGRCASTGRRRPRHGPPTPTADEAAAKRNQELCDSALDEARKREISSYENFDKAILTLSGTGLAISLSFLKDFIPITQAIAPWLLYTSWGGLTLATCLTTFSFLLAAKSQVFRQRKALDYYLHDDESARERKNPWDRLIHAVNYSSATGFIVGVAATAYFVALNLERAAQLKNSQHPLANDGMPSSLLITKVTGGTFQKGLPSAALVPKVSGSAPSPSPSPSTATSRPQAAASASLPNKPS
jgi:hypothetical protein